MTSVVNVMVTADHAVPVAPLGGTAMVFVNSGDVVYYNDNPTVSATRNIASISAGGYANRTAPTWLKSAGVSSVTITTDAFGLAGPIPETDDTRTEQLGSVDNPVISLGPANGSSAITGAGFFTGYTTLPNDASIRVLGTQGPLVSIGGASPFNLIYLGPTGMLASAPAVRLPFEIEFEFYGSRLEIAYFAQPGTSTPSLRVNGVLQATPANPSDGTMRNLLLDWSGTANPQAIRRIRLTALWITGFYHSATNGLLAPSSPKGPRLVCVGDSFTDSSTNTVDGVAHCVWQAAHLAGIRDVWPMSIVGTGYLQSGGNPNISTRFAGDVPHVKPDIIVIPAGLNDAAQTISAVVTAAKAVWSQALATGATLMVVGPWACPSSGGSPNYAGCAALDSALQVAANTMVGVNYVSPIQEQWITGTGYQGATNGTGTSDSLIYSDGVHPNQAGHAYLARRIAAHLTSVLAASKKLTWVPLTYGGINAADYGSLWPVASAARDDKGVVHLRGTVVATGAVAKDGALAILPDGMAPAAFTSVVAVGSPNGYGTLMQVVPGPPGQINSPTALVASQYVALDGVTFSTT